MFMWHLNIDLIGKNSYAVSTRSPYVLFWQPYQFFLVTWNYWSTGATTNPPPWIQAQMPLDGEMEYLCTSISPWKMWPFLFVTFHVGKEWLEHIWRRELDGSQISQVSIFWSFAFGYPWHLFGWSNISNHSPNLCFFQSTEKLTKRLYPPK